MKYLIDYGTGAGNVRTEGTLEDTMQKAEEGLCYTQTSVTIYDDDNNEVARLPWWGVEPVADDVVTARFGSSGFYGEWQEL